jgi:hypothetical protein
MSRPKDLNVGLLGPATVLQGLTKKAIGRCPSEFSWLGPNSATGPEEVKLSTLLHPPCLRTLEELPSLFIPYCEVDRNGRCRYEVV